MTAPTLPRLRLAPNTIRRSIRTSARTRRAAHPTPRVRALRVARPALIRHLARRAVRAPARDQAQARAVRLARGVRPDEARAQVRPAKSL